MVNCFCNIVYRTVHYRFLGVGQNPSYNHVRGVYHLTVFVFPVELPLDPHVPGRTNTGSKQKDLTLFTDVSSSKSNYRFTNPINKVGLIIGIHYHVLACSGGAVSTVGPGH